MNLLAAEDTKATPLQIGLDNLLADLDQARRGQDLGKLALLVYCEVRCWARQAGETAIAEHSTTMFTAQPHDSRNAFLEQVDSLIQELEAVRRRQQGLPLIVATVHDARHAA